MKIYILTFLNTTNYGANLQAYALSTYLTSLGNNVEAIDYRPSYIYKENRWYSEIFKNISLKNIALIPSRVFASLNAYRFIHKHLFITEKCYNTTDITRLPFADMIIVGSDQVWNPSLIGTFDNGFFLNFTTKSIKVSYAASAGQDVFCEQDLVKMVSLIKGISFISVREKEFCEKLNTLGIKNATFVLDPVFLLDISFYHNLAKVPHCGNYVLTYYSDENHLTEKLAKRIANSLGAKVLKIGGLRNKDGIKGLGFVSISEFLGLIEHAAYIVSPSFHAVAFSIIFHKPFFAINAGARSSRLLSILDCIDLKTRFIYSNEEIDKVPIETIDYQVVENKLTKYKDNSKLFLSSVLQYCSKRIKR